MATSFDEYVNNLLENMMSSTVFGPNAPGDQGGQVPGGSPTTYAPDNGAIIPTLLGAKKSKNRKKVKVPIQRRSLNQ